MNPDSGLLLDLYQLTMVEAFLQRDMREIAVFELFVRKLPRRRNFLLAAGLERALAHLENLRFRPEEIEWLASTGRFHPGLLDYLASFRFSGDVDAMPEGTAFFRDEPILRVIAPLPEAQLVETRLINILQLDTILASKAARCVLAAPGKQLIDFGVRRAHGFEAGMAAARSAYLAGFAGTSTVLADKEYGVPSYGTVAHSFIQVHDDETEAFLTFARSQPDNAILLIDTYDTVAAANKITELAPRLEAEGIPIRAVRLDSGDLARLSRQVRRIFDQAGLRDIQILASGGLDEFELERLVSTGAPIDGFGVGTALTTSADAPALDCAYKLQEYAGVARRKRSTGKATWPGRKQVYRRRDPRGSLESDVLTIEAAPAEGDPLLEPVMRGGHRLSRPEPLEQIRERAAGELAHLPLRLRALEDARVPYPVEVSRALRALAAEVDERTGST